VTGSQHKGQQRGHHEDFFEGAARNHEIKNSRARERYCAGVDARTTAGLEILGKQGKSKTNSPKTRRQGLGSVW